jgi:prophage tail gpP-like protein
MSDTTPPQNGLVKFLAQNGQLPTVSLFINALQDQTKTPQGKGSLNLTGQNVLSFGNFLSYRFQSSILIPVDSFSFTMVAPDDPTPIKNYVNEGDIAILDANGTTISTGLIDQIEVEFDMNAGEKITISGRNLMAQLEDQDVLSITSQPIYYSKLTASAVIKFLIQNTRIQGYVLQQAPSLGYDLATEPGESKLSALTRWMDPLNCIAWMNPLGQLVFGKPNMAQDAIGNIILNKDARVSNVTSIRATYASTQIPNIYVPMWSSQEGSQAVSPSNYLYNGAVGPTRLRKLGFVLTKSAVTSNPSAGSPSENANQANQYVTAAQNAANGTILQAYAKRLCARGNMKELLVQAIVPGHYNENGQPYLIDTCYNVVYDKAGVQEKMYLYQVEYAMDPEKGQTTTLDFCRLGTIVADIQAQ